MSNSLQQVPILLILLSYTMFSVECALIARPEFMPPRITNLSGGTKQLLQEIEELDLNPQDNRHSKRRALNTRNSDEASIVSMKSNNKPEFIYELHCTSDISDVRSSCCGYFEGSIECKPVILRPAKPIKTETPVKKIDKAQSEIQKLVANFEKNLFNKMNAQLQRKAGSRSGFEFQL